MKLYVDILNFCDELEKVVHSKSKAKGNQEDELLKLVDESIENVEIHEEASPFMITTSFGTQVEGRV